MRRHLKSRFQMLRHNRLNEVAATDTYFSNEIQLKDIIVHKYSLYVAGTKSESEFVGVHLDFIRRYGIPSAL